MEGSSNQFILSGMLIWKLLFQHTFMLPRPFHLSRLTRGLIEPFQQSPGPEPGLVSSVPEHVWPFRLEFCSTEHQR